MAFIDLHCDTVTLLLDQNKALAENDFCVSISNLREAGVFCQFFALYVKLQAYAKPEQAFERAMKLHERFLQEMQVNRNAVSLVHSVHELEHNCAQGRLSAILTVEEGGICGESIEKLYALYNMGVRLVTLTWNFENALGYPNSDDAAIMATGLKPFGLTFVEEMNRLGMIIDVSHLSDGGFWDVARISSKPFVASHSNARCVCNFRRNLTDAQLRALAEKGGVTGINFYHRFLGDESIGSIAQMMAHIRHIKKVAGIDAIAIGTDFDGFESPCEIQNSAQLIKLSDALKVGGFSSEEIDKICFKNALRVIRDVLP